MIHKRCHGSLHPWPGSWKCSEQAYVYLWRAYKSLPWNSCLGEVDVQRGFLFCFHLTMMYCQHLSLFFPLKRYYLHSNCIDWFTDVSVIICRISPTSFAPTVRFLTNEVYNSGFHIICQHPMVVGFRAQMAKMGPWTTVSTCTAQGRQSMSYWSYGRFKMHSILLQGAITNGLELAQWVKPICLSLVRLTE